MKMTRQFPIEMIEKIITHEISPILCCFKGSKIDDLLFESFRRRDLFAFLSDCRKEQKKPPLKIEMSG
jgi:hypothetical protein